MRAILLIFDSLNRHWLEPYGGNTADTSNFRRLAQRSVTFDRAFVGSMPCMPARRDLLTGRYNFLHRGWGPIEPFDECLPEMLKGAGVHSHLVTDHQHYWEDGGSTYHNRYSTCEFIRGQEGDPWKGQVGELPPLEHLGQAWRQDRINRRVIANQGRWPQEQTVDAGLEFIRDNHRQDRWLLQIETFDPHEPFFAPDRLRHPRVLGSPLHFDWPRYAPVTEPRTAVEHCREEYAALVRLCNESLGRVMDLMDRLEMWQDTLLIVTTDHGFLLGEHEWWAKCRMPFYNEIAHIPLFMWHPELKFAGQRSEALVQWIDLAPTLAEYFGVPRGEHMQGVSLTRAIQNPAEARTHALFGMFGSHLNVTDGRSVLMIAPDPHAPRPFEYTLMPMRMRRLFGLGELKEATLHPGFRFTRGMPVLRVPGQVGMPDPKDGAPDPLKTLYFDFASDPEQVAPLGDEPAGAGLRAAARELLAWGEAPEELRARYGLVATPALPPAQGGAR